MILLFIVTGSETMLFVLSLLLSTLQLSTAENFVRCEVDGNALCETTLCTHT